MYRTTLKQLLETYHAVKTSPDVHISTGMWTCSTWTAADFHAWFLKCLLVKINRKDKRAWRKLAPEYQIALAHDAYEINNYTGHRIRHSGCSGLLRTPEMRRRYPQVNSQPREDW